MTRSRRVPACISTLAVLALCTSFFVRAGAADPASAAAANAAVSWLGTQQQPDGGFEIAAPGSIFETPDVVLAVAENAQTGTTWNANEALAAVQALQVGGVTPLDYIESFLAGDNDVGRGARMIVQVAVPLGIDPTAFGSVNLVTRMGGCSNTAAPTFNGRLYLALAQQLVCSGAPAALITDIRDAQQTNGGWGFAGDPTTDDMDNDTTALAVEALVGSGATASDPDVHAALMFLAESFHSNGAWQSFGSDDPNSTALAIIAITAAGYDVATSCWRDTLVPATAGTPYTGPDAWLRSQQLTSGADAGRVQSPADQFPPISTFATSQSVQGLLRSWLPVARAAPVTCSPTSPTSPTSSPTGSGTPVQVGGITVTATAGDPIAVQPRFTG
jgi:hypothetical protein